MSTVQRVLVGWGIVPTILLGLLMALVLWVVAWRYCIPRILGIEYRWRSSRLWRDSLIYPGINAVIVLAATAVAGVLFWVPIGYLGYIAGLIVAALVILPVLFGVPGVLVFLKRHLRSLDASKGRAVAAYIVVILATNLAYVALAFGYAALMGII